MELSEIETYVSQNLSAELQIVQRGGFFTACPALEACEKAMIYYYTCDGDGYRTLNRELHTSNGDNHSVLGRGLVASLGKLPAYTRMVHSGVHLTADQLAKYSEGEEVVWPAFLSTSVLRKVAIEFLKFGTDARPKNALFLIKSRTGRRIGDLSYFGPNGPGNEGNESEVLFMPNTRFVVTMRTNTGTETGVIEFELDEL
jgi:hypothetical protein